LHSTGSTDSTGITGTTGTPHATFRKLSKLLIANRGEVAVRIIRTCREMGIQTVVVYSDADADSRAVNLADEAVHIGAAPPASSYLRGAAIVEAALTTGCQAVHPGFGFLSENAEFAAAVVAAGLTFVGPDADSIRAMGIKPEALALARAAKVPTVPGYQGGGADADYQQAAAQIEYPVLVKAAAGGGGKGMRVVRDPSDLVQALASARREAHRAFGDSRVFLEKYLDGARHIEFQVFGDQYGQVVHLFERDCSVQRRHQKIIEESPSPYLAAADPGLRADMGAAAVRLAQAVRYVNAGTVEFIVDDRDGRFYFLEMNTRLQVEHPVTELVTGLDLVAWQLRVAMGEPLPWTQAQITQRGHAIECRVYAEDPANQFLPATGNILRIIEPQSPGVRVDSGVRSGDTITIHYDPMLAKVIVVGETRDHAIRRMDAALAEYVVLGLTTNIPFLRDVLGSQAFRHGNATTDLIERDFAAWQPHPPQIQGVAATPDHALIIAALSDMLAAAPVTPHRLAIGTTGAAETIETAGDAYTPWDRADGFRLGR
jgi:acetyl-CoA carboxylase biotin carboxylase subunit